MRDLGDWLRTTGARSVALLSGPLGVVLMFLPDNAPFARLDKWMVLAAVISGFQAWRIERKRADAFLSHDLRLVLENAWAMPTTKGKLFIEIRATITNLGDSLCFENDWTCEVTLVNGQELPPFQCTNICIGVKTKGDLNRVPLKSDSHVSGSLYFHTDIAESSLSTLDNAKAVLSVSTIHGQRISTGTTLRAVKPKSALTLNL